jgi:hypothetical protein
VGQGTDSATMLPSAKRWVNHEPMWRVQRLHTVSCGITGSPTRGRTMKTPEHNGKPKNSVRHADPSRDGAVKKGTPVRGAAVSYDAFKQFEGKRYTGVKVGRSHKWYYDQGEWKETKVTPDEWQFTYAVKKRRAGKAPEGSGVPVGTEYHWLILAHQNVQKLSANDYSTSMSGTKFEVAHKRADTQKWSASERAQKRRVITFLQEMIYELEGQLAETPPARGSAKKTAERPRKKPVLS